MKHKLKKRMISTFSTMAAVVISLPLFPSVASAYAPQIRPGDTIGFRDSSGESTHTCTIGPFVDSIEGITMALTAGHCGEFGDKVYWEDPAGNIRKVGALFDPRYGDTKSVFKTDHSLVVLKAPAKASATVRGESIVGIAPIASLEVGTPLCALGRRSGYRCGSVVHVDNDIRVISADFESGPGDSGGPVWISTPEGARIVGLLYGGGFHRSKEVSKIVAIETPLEDYRATLITQ